MSYIGQTLPADTFQGFTTDSFTGDGSATTFTLSKAPFSEDTLIVVINNVIQKPTTNFTVSGTTLTIVGTAVASGDVIYAIHMGGVVPSTLASKLDTNGVSDALILDADADTTISADTDDQIDVKVGGTDRVSFTSTGINLTQDGDSLKFGANSEVVLTHVHDQGLKMSHDGGGDPDLILANTASASDGNQLGTIFYNGQNSNGDEHTYAFILGQARDVTDGEEDGQLVFYGNKGGSDKQFINYGANASGASPTHEVCINEGSEDIDFRVEGNGDTHNLFVNAGTDHVGIGAGDSPSYKLTLHDTVADALFQIKNTSTSGSIYGQAIAFGYAPDDKSNHFFYCSDTIANRFFIYSDGDILADGQSINSDERLKENIVDATTKWDDVKSLKVRNFNWTKDHHPNRQHKHIGFIAQEFETIFPALVRETNIHPDPRYTQKDKDDGNIPDGKSVGDEKNILNRKSIHTTALVPILTKTLQEAMAKIETLETKVKALEDA